MISHFTKVKTLAVEGLLLVVLVSFFYSAAAAADAKRIMLLHSFGADFKPWNEYGKTIRAELYRQASVPLDVIDHSLVTARFTDENSESAFVDYLRALHTKHALDLIVSIGAPAASFIQKHRHQLFPETPMVFTVLENRRVQHSGLTANDTVVAVAHDFPAIF